MTALWRRLLCRVGLHRWGPWQDEERSCMQLRFCHDCHRLVVRWVKLR